MPEFAIITPTIGRETLKRCFITMQHQVRKDFMQIVVGDGPQPEWVKQECLKYGCRYVETEIKEGFYGTAPRNYVLELLESGALGEYKYVLFLDDDNLLLEPALYNIHETIQKHNSPPLIWHDILFTNKFQTKYFILPQGREPLKEGDWDSLNCIYRADIIRGLRWKAIYNHDWQFAREAAARAEGRLVKCDGIGAVHFLSWDTFDLKKP